MRTVIVYQAAVIEKVLSMLIVYVKRRKKSTISAMRTVIVYQAVVKVYADRREETINTAMRTVTVYQASVLKTNARQFGQSLSEMTS